MTGDPIREAYDENASFWTHIIQNKLDRYYVELTQGDLLSEIGNCKGLSILDAGCGEGNLARILSGQNKNTHIYGIDNCLPLIETARRHNQHEKDRVSFYHADVKELPLANSSIDLVIANRLPNAIDEPAQRFLEFARVLRPGGRLILMSQHPCFYAGRSEADGRRSQIDVREYFSGRTVARRFSVAGIESPAPSVQKIYSLEAYCSMITDAGFAITKIREPHPSDSQLKDPWWKSNFKRPMFLLVTAILLPVEKRDVD